LTDLPADLVERCLFIGLQKEPNVHADANYAHHRAFAAAVLREAGVVEMAALLEAASNHLHGLINHPAYSMRPAKLREIDVALSRYRAGAK
jgi:hypothetical protein